MPKYTVRSTKYKVLLFVIFIAVFLSTMYSVLSTSRAQDFTAEKAYQDYIFTQSNYIQAQADFKNARDSYLKNPTLTLKDEARKQTLNLLKSRDELIRVYLTALRLKIVENIGLTQDEKNAIFTKIDTEVAWYQSHKDSYSDSDSLDTLFSKNDDENQYNSNTLKVVYSAIFTESLGELRGLRLQNMDIYKSLKALIQTKIDDRWFSDIENIDGQLKANEELGQTEIAKIYGDNSFSPKVSYDDSVDQVSKSQGLLAQLNNFIYELLTSAKNQIQNGN